MMNQQIIIFPVIALILFTGCIGIALLLARYRAVREKTLSPAYFKYNRGGKPPENLLKITHHFDNLFETPVLFYIAALFLFELNKVDILFLGLAWLYVGSRFAHAWIHLGSNNIIYRKNAFLISYALLFMIWIRLSLQLLFE